MFTLRDFDPKTLSWWYDQRENIDFKPSYQRKGKIWSEKDKAYLIDSILNGFDIPKIYMADFTFFNSNLNEKRKPYAVVDGKQRFEAMFDFLEDKLTLDQKFVYLDNTSLKLGGLSFKDLKMKFPDLARKVENFNLSVRSIITDNEGMINELFIRLNKSKPLTGAELRTAMKGMLPSLLREIVELPFFRERVKFSTKRGQDSNVAAKLLLVEFRGKFVDTKKIHLDRLAEDAVKAEVADFSGAMGNLKDVLTSMTESFIPNDPLLSSSGLIPVYYWFYRTNSKQYLGDLRNFILRFEDIRKDRERNRDVYYFEFDLYTKSLNDQASLIGCFDILERKFKLWLKGKHLNEVG